MRALLLLSQKIPASSLFLYFKHRNKIHTILWPMCTCFTTFLSVWNKVLKKICEASVPLVAAAFLKVVFICFQSFSLPSFSCPTSFLPELTENIFSFKAKLIKYSLKLVSLPSENFLKCSALVSPSNFSNLEDKLIPLKLRHKKTNVHVKDLKQLKYS